jgi:hypothetical protein
MFFCHIHGLLDVRTQHRLELITVGLTECPGHLRSNRKWSAVARGDNWPASEKMLIPAQAGSPLALRL